MSLSLSTADIDGLARAMRTLLSPLTCASTTAWRQEIARAVRDLVGCDGASTVMHDGDGPLFIAEGLFDERILAEYAERWHGKLPGGKRRRARKLLAWTREDTWPASEVQCTDYYHDFCVPYANRDSAGMAAHITDKADDEVECYIHSSRPSHFLPGGREAQLLRLLQPALAAGAKAARVLGALRTDGRVLDAIDACVALFDQRGEIMHATPGYVEILSDPAVGETIHQKAIELARDSTRLIRKGNRSLYRATVSMDTCLGRFYLLGALMEHSLLGMPAPLCAVLVTPPEAPQNVAQRFRLTPRETQVTLLLAQGRRNREIAVALDMSVHTVRRHVEQVLAKLGVGSRAAVAARIA